MKAFLTILSFGIVAAVIVVASHSTMQADEPTETPQVMPSVAVDFEGKVVLFAVDESSALETKRRSISLVDPKLVKIGERYFVQGKSFAPDEVASVFQDVETAVAWERVQMYYAFTPEQFEKYVEYWQENSDD